MIDIKPSMTIVLCIHIFDWLITSIEREYFACGKSKYNPFIFYRYNDQFLFNRLSDDEKTYARIVYWIVLLGRVAGLTWLFTYVMSFRHCQPMLEVCFIQDYGVSMFLQIFLFIEQHIKSYEEDAAIDTAIQNDLINAKKHFFRLRHIMVS
jgi:hypothetical protein